MKPEIDRRFGAKLDSSIASIHSRFGLDYPILEKPQDSGNRIADLQEGAGQQMDLRRETIAMLKRDFSERDDLIAIAEIGAEMAQEFDQIYISQVNHHDKNNQQSDGRSRNWSGYNGDSAGNLKTKIEEINDKYTDFLRANVHTGNILKIIRDELVDADSPDRLEDIASRLEEEALQCNRLGKPTIVLSLSNYGTHPDGPSDRAPDMFNPDLRIIDPIPPDQLVKYQALADKLWQMLLANSSEEISLPLKVFKPEAIIGVGIMWGGAQLESYTCAEALRKGRFVLAQNILNNKVVSFVKNRFGSLLKDPDEDKIFDYALLSFILHELGHQVFGVNIFEVEELATDIPSYLTMLTAIVERNGLVSHLNIHDYLVFILAESERLLGSINTAEIFSDGYGVSSKFHLNELRRNGLLVNDADGFRINDSVGNVYLLLRNLYEIYLMLNPDNPEDKTLNEREILARLKGS